MIYLLISVFLLIPVILYDFFDEKRGWKLWYYAELIILILLVGLRYRVGGDTLIYIDFFDDYPTIKGLFDFDFTNTPFDPLWYILNAIIKSTVNDFIFFQIIHAIFVNSVFFWFFRKYTKYFFSAIFLYYIAYYLYFNMEILREILAICILMLSFGFLFNKKYVKYIICCIIAMGFHSSAMIMFVFPLLLFIPKISWKFTLIFFILLFGVLNFIDIAPFMLNLFFNNAILSEKVAIYTSMDDTLNLNGVLSYMIPVILLMYINRNSNQKTVENHIQNMLFLYAIFTCLSMFYVAIFARFQNYIVPFYIVFIVNISFPIIKEKAYRRTLSKYIINIAVCWFVFFSFKSYFRDTSHYMLGTKTYNIYYPYHSIFNPVTEVEREKFIDIYKAGE